MTTATTTTSEADSSLARRTLHTVALLVAACLVFVGLLSVVAVLITNRAVKSTSAEAHAKTPLSI